MPASDFECSATQADQKVIFLHVVGYNPTKWLV